MKQKNGKSNSGVGIADVLGVLPDTLRLIRDYPVIFMLFLSVAVVDFIALFILWWAPSEPVSFILAPIIRTFWSEDFLHYPANFLLLPKLFGHAHFLILSVFGLMISGITIKKIEARERRENISVVAALNPVLRKYFGLLTAWLISYALFSVTLKNVLAILPGVIMLQVAVGFILALCIQSVFAFLFPAIVLSNENFFKALWQGFCCGIRYLFATALVIFGPIAAVVAIAYLKSLSPVFVQHHPELVLWVLMGGIVVTMVVDLVVTSSTTLLFLKVRKSS